MRIITFTLTLILFNACSSSDQFNPSGTYVLETEGIRTIDAGILQIGGQPGDYFGTLSFTGTRDRNYSLGLEYFSPDSMSFFISGNGYLRLVKQETNWVGDFKYFGLEGKIKGTFDGPLDQDKKSTFDRIIEPKPLGYGVITTKVQETFPTFDPFTNTLYFTRENALYSSKNYNGDWSEPEQLSFSGNFSDSAPYLADSGRTMIFTSERPAFGSSESMRKNIWKTTKSGSGAWSAPAVYPEPVNIDSLGEYHGGISSNGNLYFVSFNRDGGYGRSDIYKATDSETGFIVENLGPVINTPLSEADVFVDSQERFILFISTSREDSYGGDDIYISIHEDGNWSEPKNVGPEVNSYAFEYGPWIDPVNKHLYFNSARRGSADIYRVPIQKIPLLRPFFD